MTPRRTSPNVSEGTNTNAPEAAEIVIVPGTCLASPRQKSAVSPRFSPLDDGPRGTFDK